MIEQGYPVQGSPNYGISAPHGAEIKSYASQTMIKTMQNSTAHGIVTPEVAMPDEDYIDTKGAAQRWKISESYIRKLIRQQRIIAKKVRRDWVVGIESLDEYMRGPRKVGRPRIDKPNK